MKLRDARAAALAGVITFCAVAHGSPRITSSTLTGRFFANESDSGAFSATLGSPVVFRQQFAAINFNPPEGTLPCKNPTNINQDSRPFADVVLRRDGSCSVVVAQGNGQQAGVGNLASFNAVFTGTFTISEAGRVTFNIYADDGWMLGIGWPGSPQPSFVSGPMESASAGTPFSHLPVVGAYNTATSPVRQDLVVNFPAPGTFDFELDYSECCGGELALTLTADTVAIATSGFPIEPVLGVIAVGAVATILARWRNRNERKRRRQIQKQGFAARVVGHIRGGPQVGYRMEIRGTNQQDSGRDPWDE